MRLEIKCEKCNTPLGFVELKDIATEQEQIFALAGYKCEPCSKQVDIPQE